MGNLMYVFQDISGKDNTDKHLDLTQSTCYYHSFDIL